MKKKLLFGLLLLTLPFYGDAQQQSTKPSGGQVITFRFIAKQDMFFIPYAGNEAEMNRLYALVDEYRAEIATGKLPIHVEGYCASSTTAEENLKTAAVRSNRVKSELITHKGVTEAHFVTENHATAYTAPDGGSYGDMVVVTLHIPAKAAAAKPAVEKKSEPQSEPQPERRHEPEPVVEKQAEQQPVPAIEALSIPSNPYCFAVRTNLLYDAFLTPTLGVEWRANRHIGIKVDGSLAWWGGKHGKIQKVWLLNPELRWYPTENKRFYAGLSGNYGEYNIYKGVVGRLVSDDTGYQGKVYGGGLTVGYQLPLSKSLGIDFNFGLGYTHFGYDRFTVINETRVFKDRDKTKNVLGPSQAGISLIWTFGGN